MATKVLVNGKYQTRAGVYATIKSGVKNPTVNQSSGNILIIDDGIGAGFGGGSGINGTFQNGINSVYELNTLQDFRAFVKGGELYNLAAPLFSPATGVNGAAKVYLVRAATTTKAEMSFTLTGGSFTIQTKDEGVGANGVLASGNLSLGIGSKIIQTGSSGTKATGTVTFASTGTNGDSYSLRIFSPLTALGNYTKASSDTTTAAMATALAASVNANTITHGYTAVASNSDVIITAPLGGTAYNGLKLDLVNGSVVSTANLSGGLNGTGTGVNGFTLQIYHGTYKGIDALNSVPYDGVLNTEAKPQLLIQSPAFTTVAQLVSWMQTSLDFNAGFTLKAGSTATGNFAIGDITNGYVLATGATETYGATDFDDALAVVNNLDFTHILATKFGANATSLNNTKLFDFVVNTSKYERLLVVAGGYDKSEFLSSQTTSAFYNNDKVVVVHGGVKKTSRTIAGFSVCTQLYHAAAVLGRVAGLPSQVPVTLKSLGVDGFVHPLTETEQEKALEKGIVYSYYDYELKYNVVGAGITSLQKNDFLINDDGTTFNWALKRINAELLKTIIVECKKRFFGGNSGGNASSTSPEEAVIFVTGLLNDSTASDKKDGLILFSRNIAASIEQDIMKIGFEFKGNTEVSKILVTGTIIG